MHDARESRMVRSLGAGIGTIIVCLLVSLMMPGPATASADPSIEEYLGDWRQSNGVPGAAVAVLDGTEVSTWTLGEDGHGAPVASDTPFLIGSVAKTVTSAMVLQLVDEGRVSLDDTARTHMPWLDHDATIRQLLDHTAGYSAGDGLAVSERFRADLSVTDAARELDHSGEIGEYSYGSADYLVLGALVEQITGHPFAQELHHRITGPAQMADTDVDEHVPGLPPGHRLWWGSHPVAYGPRAEPSGASYGYLVSTLDDLVAYSHAQLRAELTSDDMRAEAWSEQAGTGDGSGYGLGWRIDTGDGTLRVHHSGATPGYFAHVMVMPEEDRAVIVLANAYSEARAPSLFAAAADIDRLSQGDTTSPKAGDAMSTALPWLALMPVGLGLLLLIGLCLRRPRTQPVTLILVVTSVLVAGLLALAPMLLGMSWHIVRTWAPEVALGFVAGIVVWAAVALFPAVTGRRLRTMTPVRSE